MKRFFIIALLVFATHLHAQVRIGEREAFSIATVFMEQNAKQGDVALNLAETVSSKHSGQTNLFVFSVQPRGFVIVSATSEVLAYSLNSVFPSTDVLPDHIAYWIDLYNEATDYRIEHRLPRIRHEASPQEVEPMLTSAWGQGCFHNKYCPETEWGPCNHALAGCVAVAMAQIMYYHKQPTTGIGAVSYNSHYGTLSANFGQTTYQWEEMADTLHESNPATALLISHCGISVKMNYGPQLSTSSSVNAHKAFRYYFSYPSASLSERYDFDDETWTCLIKSNLDRNLPVYYAGTSPQGRHAFVCDGYDSNGYYHFNFGWDGVADGYYTLETPSGFSVDQTIIHDLLPVSHIPLSGDSHGIIYVTPEGSGDGSSWAQATSNMQLAIYKAQTSGLSVWVKEGTYTGMPYNGYAFTLFGNCQIYGGFEGNEPFDYDLALRDFEAHPSILDGSQAYGVVNTEDIGISAVIDGFTIQNGSATRGGGLSVNNSIHLRNCKICHNQAQYNGGGIALTLSNISVRIVIEDCEFFGNEATNGGAISDGGNATYLRCKIHDNTAIENGGGIHRSANSSPSHFAHCQIHNNAARLGGGVSDLSKATFWSCLINNNTAETGGGCYIKGGTNLYNCTIVKNEGLNGYSGIYNMAAEAQNEIKNCIIWGNVSPDGNKQIGPLAIHRYCAVQHDNTYLLSNFCAESENDGDSPGFYVRFSNPDVVAGINGHDGDWHLQSSSLCIDRTSSIAQQPETDLDGNPRLRHSNVDLGAYESDAVAHVINRVFCNDDPYYYHGILLPTPGTYSFMYPSVPYDSLVIIQLDWYTLVGEAEICEGETYDFFGETLQEAGHYTTIRNCIIYELNLVVKPMPVVTLKAEICEGETYMFFGETLHAEGHYSAINDCKAYELELTVTPTPIETIEEEICEGESYKFFGQTLRKAGLYSVFKDCKVYELYLSVKPRPALRCSNDTVIDYGNQIQLTATGADAYLWSTGETTESITVAPKEDKTYYVKGVSANSCERTVAVTVRVRIDNDKVTLYPNPASDKAEVYLPFIDAIEVFNLFGERQCHIDANRESVLLDVSILPDGVYIVQVKQLNNLYHKKLVVQH